MRLLRAIKRRLRPPRPAPVFVADPNPPPSGLSAEEVRALVAQVPYWYHYIELGHGIVTPGHFATPDNPTRQVERLKQLCLPEDLTGQSVLDIGAWDGYLSFACERLGAARVLAIDSHYRGLPGSDRRGFDIAKQVLASAVEYREMDCLDLSPEAVGLFDVVLFLGVLYHLRNPFLGLERVASVTRNMLVLETHVDMTMGPRPAARFYADGELKGDLTSFWGPNPQCVSAMLRSVGFTRVERVSLRADRLIVHAFE